MGTLTVDTHVASQIANFARVWLSINRAGVCGIVTPSAYSMGEANILTGSLLAKLVELEFTTHPEGYCCHTVTLSQGGAKMSDLVKQLLGVKAEFEDIDLCMSTGTTHFKVITGKHLSTSPISQDGVREFAISNNLSLDELALAPLPFVTNTYEPYEIVHLRDGFSEIRFGNVDQARLDDMKAYLRSI
jgi:hypothetical protein